MSDNERHLPATERQKQRFAERGEVPRSRDLSNAITLAGTAIGVYFAAAAAARGLLLLVSDTYARLGAHLDAQLWVHQASAVAVTLTPVLAACVLGACASALLQAGGNMQFRAVTLDLNRLAPLSRLTQLFSPGQAVKTITWSATKVTVLLLVMWHTLHDRLPRAIAAHNASLMASVGVFADVLGTLMVRCLMALVAIGLTDFAMTWWRMQQRMRMTHQEVRDESKQDAGDPRLRAHRRRRHRDLVRVQQIAAVAAADVVLVNPTHYAVALHYNAKAMGAPRLVAKGADHAAARIREKARKHGIPIVSQPPLTRLLFKKVGVGRAVPHELYQAVALVLAHVYSLRRRA